MPRLARAYPWQFRTKLDLAVQLLRWLRPWVCGLGKALWLVADGAYAKRSSLRPAQALGFVVFSRMRKDADLRGLPPPRPPGRRGRPPVYGKARIDLAKRAGQRRGWQCVQCVQYGKRALKRIKTFVATWRPAGGVIRVVLVAERVGWLALLCTDAAVGVEAVLEALADRGAIEQAFKDVKEVWGAGQQQVRNVYACIGAIAVDVVLFSMVEAWAWARARRSWWTGAVVHATGSPVVRRTRTSVGRCSGRFCVGKSEQLWGVGQSQRNIKRSSRVYWAWQLEDKVSTESTASRKTCTFWARHRPMPR